MYCQNCGKKLNDDAKFCYACGAKIVIPKKDDAPVPQEKERKHFEEADPFDMWDETERKRPTKRGKRKKRKRKIGCGTAILVVLAILVVIAVISSMLNRNTRSSYNKAEITGIDAFNGSEKYIGSGANSYSSTYNSFSHKCEAEGCTKEGIYSIKGLTGKTEYYCYSHLQGIKALLDYMLDE